MQTSPSTPEPAAAAADTASGTGPEPGLEAGYARVFHALPQPCWIYDLDTRSLLDCSDEAAAQFGYPRGELLARTLDDLFPAGAAPMDGAVWRGRRRDGSALELEVTTRALLFGGKSARLVLASDVSGRARAEQALRASEERFRRIFEQGSLGIAMVGRDLRVLEVNATLCRMLEYSADELGRLVLADVMHVDDVDTVKALTDRLFSGEIAEAASELRCVTRSRETIWVAVNVSLVRDEQGIPLYALWMTRNISGQKHIEQALRESEDLYRELFEKAADIVYTHDLEGNFTSVNRAAERIMGYTLDEMLRMNAAQIVAPAEIDRLRPLVERPAADGLSPMFEVEIVARDGRHIPLEISSRLVYQDGKAVAVQGIAREVSARKRAEEALRQARDKLAEQVEELEQHAREIESLGDLGDLLQACLTSEEAYAVFSQVARRLFTAEDGALCVIGGAQLVEVAASWGTAVPLEVFAPEECWALRRGRVHAVEDTAGGMNCKHLGATLPGSYVCVPMMAQGETLGVLHLSTPRRNCGAVRHQLAVTVAEHVALALSNLKLQETLRSQSIRDPRTGLFNRRFMEESLERELQRTSRAGGSLGVVMVEIEAAGGSGAAPDLETTTALLQEAGRLLQNRAQGEDIACRYGTRQLTLILLDSPPEATRARAEELRAALAGLSAPGAAPAPRCEFFLGTADFPEHGPDATHLLRTAADALRRDREAWGAEPRSGA